MGDRPTARPHPSSAVPYRKRAANGRSRCRSRGRTWDGLGRGTALHARRWLRHGRAVSWHPRRRAASDRSWPSRDHAHVRARHRRGEDSARRRRSEPYCTRRSTARAQRGSSTAAATTTTSPLTRIQDTPPHRDRHERYAPASGRMSLRAGFSALHGGAFRGGAPGATCVLSTIRRRPPRTPHPRPRPVPSALRRPRANHRPQGLLGQATRQNGPSPMAGEAGGTGAALYFRSYSYCNTVL